MPLISSVGKVHERISPNKKAYASRLCSQLKDFRWRADCLQGVKKHQRSPLEYWPQVELLFNYALIVVAKTEYFQTVRIRTELKCFSAPFMITSFCFEWSIVLLISLYTETTIQIKPKERLIRVFSKTLTSIESQL